MKNTIKLSLVCAATTLALLACDGPQQVTSPKPSLTANPKAPLDDSAAAQFAAVQTPANGRSEVYGAYTRGCIAGAQQLPLDAPHWQVLNPSRNRAWGHPSLIAFIQTLADGVAQDGHRGLLVGDLAQPRGGPLPSDHNSHQVGLDADIWLTPLPGQRLNKTDLETFEPPSMVDITRLTTNEAFGAAQFSLLKRAAQAEAVERIFVSPPIKQALCEQTKANQPDWLRKIRPWRGHMAHMHVRLSCPTGSPNCDGQEQPPEGNGCGAELASWFKDTS